MKRHNARKKKVMRKKNAFIASISRIKTVNNIPKNKPVIDKKNLKEVKFGENDVHLIQKVNEWKNEKHPQYKQMIKYKKCNDFLKYFPKFPYILPKMNNTQYMEKLVQHKLNKWMHNNPRPADMFTEDIADWEKNRVEAEEHIRNFVVSIYDKLLLTGRFQIGPDKYDEKLVATIKDSSGDGHKVGYLKPGESKLLDKAQDITNKLHAKNINLVCTNLRDHKRQRGRIILPNIRQAA